MAIDIEKKPVFAVCPMKQGTMLLVGMPDGAIAYLNETEGNYLQFSLRSHGIPFDFMLFRDKDHAACMKQIEQMAKNAGMPLSDARNKDSRIRDKDDKPIGEF